MGFQTLIELLIMMKSQCIHMVPSPEAASGGHVPSPESPGGHGKSQIMKKPPEINGLSDSEEDPSLEEVPALDGVPNEEETSATEEIPEKSVELQDLKNSSLKRSPLSMW